MHHQTDFMAFYEELGLHPGCTIDELKSAYRRRVWALHPDRSAGGDAARLQYLTAAYTAATRFHRRHGRMPGSAAPATRGPLPRREPAASPATAARRPRRWPWVAFACTVAALAVLAMQSDDDDRAEVAARAAPAVVVFARESPAPAPIAAPAHFELGASMDDVRALEGRPLMESARRWDYGPSWIEFNDGKVSDWYSSKLRPLKVASAHPPPPEPATR